jgi:hypothetical protein
MAALLSIAFLILVGYLCTLIFKFITKKMEMKNEIKNRSNVNDSTNP